MLGRALADGLPHLGYQVAALARAACDVADAAGVAAALERERPSVVFNAAAWTDVDGAERDPEGARRTNALGPETLARACSARGAVLVHYSTDFVFDGTLERPYHEGDAPAPQSVYARSKLAGERMAAAAARRVFVVRVGCLYGRGGRNFPSTIARRLRDGQSVRADAGRVGSPTWAADVVRVSAALAHTDGFGVYHCTSQGEVSWADYARFVAGEIGAPDDRVQALPTEALAMLAPRPRRAILDNRALRERGLDSMPTWQEAARAFLRHDAG